MKKEIKSQVILKDEPMLRYWNKGGFALCVDGSTEISINEQYYRLTRGDVFIVTPLIQIYDFKPDENYREISFINDLKIFYPIFQLISDTNIPMQVREAPCWNLSEKEIAYIVWQNEQIKRKQIRITETDSSDEQRLLHHSIQLILHETMLEIVSNRIRSFSELKKINRQATVAYRFILSLHENYFRERSVSWYASKANLTSGHFAFIVKNVTRKTPSQWIADITVTYVKLMLEQSDKTIKEIARELNFPEQFTFRKYFKQHVGISPKKYRANYRHPSP